jgi:hypothetical protein
LGLLLSTVATAASYHTIQAKVFNILKPNALFLEAI